LEETCHLLATQLFRVGLAGFLEAAGRIGLEDNPMNGAWRTPLVLCAVAVMRLPALPLPQPQRYDAAVYEPNQD
jgi:hypothetical protein